MTPCPSSLQLQRLLGEQLSGPDRQTVERHVQACAACQQALERLVSGQEPPGLLRLRSTGSNGRPAADAEILQRLKDGWTRPDDSPRGRPHAAWPAPAGYEILEE